MEVRLWEKAVYWIATLLMFALMLFSVQLYLRSPDAVADIFAYYSYPTYAVYPLAAAKLIALFIILLNRWRNLKDIAYGAYFINMIMATYAHVQAGEQPVHAYVGMVVVPLSYIFSNRVRGVPRSDAFLLKGID